MMKNSDILYIYFMLGKRGVTVTTTVFTQTIGVASTLHYKCISFDFLDYF